MKMSDDLHRIVPANSLVGRMSGTSRPTRLLAGTGIFRREDVYAAYAHIQNGRYLIVFFIKKTGGKLLPISARDMDNAERRYYEKNR